MKERKIFKIFEDGYREGICYAIAFIALVSLFSVMLITTLSASAESKDEKKRMVLVENDISYGIYYDEDTMVMYIGTARGGFTVMVNPDGTPKLYEKG